MPSLDMPTTLLGAPVKSKATQIKMSAISTAFMKLLQDSTVYIPSFDGTSYLELKPLASFLQPLNDRSNRPTIAEDTTFYLTVKTRSTQGTILFSE
ncbi:hypothetical protein ATANTOWER_011106 [Ataeniobius toweri]|uniref:Uncharacterized protein n=1 Tax=Ataeniobius toweri TaxID=208326 RepID=A0ABU7BI17_9TELE|nr:hypothetical protein [Ataeniobius toweri]